MELGGTKPGTPWESFVPPNAPDPTNRALLNELDDDRRIVRREPRHATTTVARSRAASALEEGDRVRASHVLGQELFKGAHESTDEGPVLREVP